MLQVRFVIQIHIIMISTLVQFQIILQMLYDVRFTLRCFLWSIEFYPERTFFEYIEVFKCQGKCLADLASDFNSTYM